MNMLFELENPSDFISLCMMKICVILNHCFPMYETSENTFLQNFRKGKTQTNLLHDMG